MRQLSGVDTAFLSMETPTVFGHVSNLMIFKKPHPDFVPIEAVVWRYAALVSHIEPLHRRLVEVPFELDLPYWVVDPNLDLDFHIREQNLPAPGRVDQLTDQVARIVGRPMDRSKPLWEVYVIGGLEDDQWALLTKYHHAAIDGAGGARLLSLINDTAPEPGTLPDPRPLEAEPVPDGAELLRTAMTNLQLNPYKAMHAQFNMHQKFAEAFAKSAPPDPTTLDQPPAAPPTPWNKAISANRRLAIRSTSLENIRHLKSATGTTVNDVILAVCAGALRRYLLAHNALPDAPLRAAVPVSIRTGDEADPWSNRVATVSVELPTDSDDPVERLNRCHTAMLEAKRQFSMVPADAMMDLTRYSAPVLAASASRITSQLRLADQYAQPYNVVISNIPGPRQRLYFAGAPLQHQFPVSMLADGLGLNVTVHGYMDKLDFGLIVDRDLVPDVWDLVDMHIEEIGNLFEAAGVEWVVPPEQPTERRGPLSRVAARPQTRSPPRPAAPELPAGQDSEGGRDDDAPATDN